MKILMLGNNDSGLYKLRKELLEKLINEHEVYVSVPEGEYINEIEAIGCKVIVNRQLERRGTNPVRDLRLFCHYSRLVREIDPDIVFTYTIKPNVYGGLVCSQRRIPYLANITGLGTSVENGGILQRLTLTLYKAGLAHAEKVFFQNRENLEFFLRHRVIKGCCEVLPGSGVNITQHCYEPYPDERGPLVFSMIGRIMRDKGMDELLSAAEKIKEKYPDVTFRLIGFFDDDYEEKIRQAENKGVVEYVGQQRDIHPWIKESNAVIHPSYHEGMSNVLLETAATGRPILASDIPGCREAFEEGVSGLGFKPQNVGELVKAIEKFIGLSHEEKAAMGRAGRRKMEQEFSRDIVIEKYIAEIDKIKER